MGIVGCGGEGVEASAVIEGSEEDMIAVDTPEQPTTDIPALFQASLKACVSVCEWVKEGGRGDGEGRMGECGYMKVLGKWRDENNERQADIQTIYIRFSMFNLVINLIIKSFMIMMILFWSILYLS